MTVTWNGAQIVAQVERARDVGLKAGSRVLLNESNKLVPKDSTNLEASAKRAVRDDEAAVGYDSPYAVRQHEKLNYQHKQGQAKYLETALRNNADAILDAVADAVRRELRG